MRNESATTHDDNQLAPEQSALVGAAPQAPDHFALDPHSEGAPLTSEVWTGQFPADFTQEELYFMLEVAALFPSDREFVALLGGDAAQAWDVESDDEDATSQAASPEQRTVASVFERLKLPVPTPALSKKKK